VLEVSKRILEIAGACYSDRNAAVADARFFPCTRNLDELDPQIVYARRWVDDQGVVDEDKKAAMQAEILVPDSISPEFLRSVVFRSQDDAWHFQQRYNANIAVKVDAKRFFE
jgi:hypothetical protein